MLNSAHCTFPLVALKPFNDEDARQSDFTPVWVAYALAS